MDSFKFNIVFLLASHLMTSEAFETNRSFFYKIINSVSYRFLL